MSSYYFGIIEGVLIVGLIVAFYIWQMRSLKRDIKTREEREAREASSTPPPTARHPERQHQLDKP